MKVPMWFAWSALLVGWPCLRAQQYVISTIAGGAPPATPVAAIKTTIARPLAVATDAAGSVYFTSTNNCVFKVDTSGILTRIAGNAKSSPYANDGGPAATTPLEASPGIAIDSGGTVYLAVLDRIRKVSPAGIITTVAGGGGGPGALGDGGPAIAAYISFPQGVAVDASGNLYISDVSLAPASNRIRKVSPSGVITTIAGSASAGFTGDRGPATNALLNNPYGLAADVSGNLYIADRGNNRIRKISTDGTINTVAGNGTAGYSGDGGPAASAELNQPYGVAVDSRGNLYIADAVNNRVRRVSPDGIITSIAGTGDAGYSGDNRAAPGAQLSQPLGVALDPSGNVYIADSVNARVRKVSATGMITTVAGDGTYGEGGPASGAQLNQPNGLAVDTAGDLYIADSLQSAIRKVSVDGTFYTVAGNGISGYSGDGDQAINARLRNPFGVAVGASGDLYIADTGNHAIRRVSPAGVIATIAGNGAAGFSGDGGPATAAQLNGPASVAVDADGNIYIADTNNNRIRKVSSGGVITTLAGRDGVGFAPEFLNRPRGVAVDGSGNVFVADTNSHQVKILAAGSIVTVAGDGTCRYSVSVVPPSPLCYPYSVAVDDAGSIYIADTSNNRIGQISAGRAVVSTIAGRGSGSGIQGYSGDGGPATSAVLSNPAGVAVDFSHNVYIADSINNAIRVLRLTAPVPSITAITNAATNLPGPVAPGEMVVIYGEGIGPAQLTQNGFDVNGRIGTVLAGTQVFFTCGGAPVLYSSAGQVAAVVPYSCTGSSSAVYVLYQGQATNSFRVSLTSASPGLFTADSSGKGQAAAVNQDGTYNSAANPATAGSVILLYATGEGQTSPAGIDGKPGSLPLPRPLGAVTVNIGGQPAEVPYAGGAPDLVAGVMQINVRLPTGIPPGSSVPVLLQVGSARSQSGVTIAVAGN